MRPQVTGSQENRTVSEARSALIEHRNLSVMNDALARLAADDRLTSAAIRPWRDIPEKLGAPSAALLDCPSSSPSAEQPNCRPRPPAH
jgi:hypothetical protein